ncbi:MAG: hypothetical protein LUG93_13600 [Lachnospiraceae bacterium]|nr:hypothetical protein [Lachnospiraceae bacterium]
MKEAYERGELTVTAAADKLDISRGTFRKWMKENTVDGEKTEGVPDTPEIDIEEAEVEAEVKTVGAVGEEGL